RRHGHEVEQPRRRHDDPGRRRRPRSVLLGLRHHRLPLLMSRRRQLNLPLVVAYAATVALAGLYAGHRAGLVTVPGLDALELASIDARFKLRGPRPLAGDEIVIVALD